MFEGIVRRHFPLYLLVNVVLVAGSPGIYSSDLARSQRHASCPSCSRDCPAALANWNAAPYARGVEAETARWPNGERPFEPRQPSLPSSPYSLNPPNPYGRALGSGGATAINRSAGGTCRRENPFAFESRDLDTDLASAPTAAFHALNVPVAPYQSRGFANLGRPFNKVGFYDLIKRQSIPPANNEHLPYDSPKLGPPPLEDSKTKLSVVYRADKYDDGSNEEAPLYPFDYPPRQVSDKRPGARRQVGGADRLGQTQRDQSRDSRLASGSNYEAQSRDFRFAQKDESRNSRMTDRFVPSRDQLSATHGFINPQEQSSNYGNDQLFIQPQEDEFSEPSMRYGFTNPQENQFSGFRKAQRFAQEDEPRNSKVTDRFVQTRDQSRDQPSATHGFIDLQDESDNYGNDQLFIKSQEDESSMEYGFMNPKEDQSSDFRKVQRFAQPQDQLRDSRITDRFSQPRDQSRDPSVINRFMNHQDQTSGIRMDQLFVQPQEDQPRDSRMTERFNQLRDQFKDPSVISGFMNPPEDQTSGFRIDQRFVQSQEDQSRDPRTTNRFIQRQEDGSRDPSLSQLPEVRFDSRDLTSNFNIMKMIHQVGAMLGNRSSLEDSVEEKNSREVEKQGGHRESQVIQKINGGDQVNKGVDPREKQLQEEVKEKRGAADRKITADDQLDWSGAELVQFQSTTELPALDLTNIETMA